MIKKLQMNEPLMTTYPHHASLFSMLDLDKRSRSWIYHNFLLVILSHNDEGAMDWTSVHNIILGINSKCRHALC